MRVLGLDIGTSAVKAALVDPATGRAVSARSSTYAMDTPAPDHFEQDPAVWLQAVRQAVAALGDPGPVDAIAFSGQMHGAVLTARDGRPVRPAILWPDRRAEAEAAEIARAYGPERLHRTTGSPSTANYVLAKLLWLHRHEPEALQRAEKVLLPKDWVRLQLGGIPVTEPTDASGTGVLDLQTLQWEPGLLGGLPPGLLPEIVPSAHVAGRLDRTWAAVLRLAEGTPLVAGAGDLPAAMLAAEPRHLPTAGPSAAASGARPAPDPGTADRPARAPAVRGLGDPTPSRSRRNPVPLSPGAAYAPARPVLNVGSAGQVVLTLAAGAPWPEGAQVFAHPDPDRRIALGALLAAGLAVAWARDRLGGAEPLPPDRVPPVVFLPHLAGERIPSYDLRPRGAWLGLSLETTAGEMLSAALYGVALAYREVLEHMTAGQPHARPLVLAEGPYAADWARRLANALGRDVDLLDEPSPSAVGAAMLAAAGVGAATRDAPSTSPVACDRAAAALAQRLYAEYRAWRALVASRG